MSIRDQFIALSQSQVGYTEGNNNWTKYADYFDNTAWQYFNGKKQNVAWCSTYIHWLFCNLPGVTPDQIRSFLGEPSPKDNCACGVSFFANYMKAKGWKIANDQGQPGDIITFNNNDHVGHIESVDETKYYTIEGNKNNKVSRCEYAKVSGAIAGVFRPDWAKIDTTAKEDLKPTPAPQPAPEPVKVGYPGPWPTIPARGYFKKNDSGSEVVKLQNVLLWIKPGCLAKYGADGKLGNETILAVKSVQQMLGVGSDGLYGPRTQAAAQTYRR